MVRGSWWLHEAGRWSVSGTILWCSADARSIAAEYETHGEVWVNNKSFEGRMNTQLLGLVEYIISILENVYCTNDYCDSLSSETAFLSSAMR